VGGYVAEKFHECGGIHSESGGSKRGLDEGETNIEAGLG